MCLSHLKARGNIRGTLWSAREIASVALSAEQEKHTGCFSLCLKGMLDVLCYRLKYGYFEVAWRASFSSRNMAAPHVKPTRQPNAAARLIRRARVPIVSLILLWKISLTYFTLHENLICLIDCLRILPDSQNLKEYLYGLLRHA